ncbi:MAG TPA: M56 family metallopeptidase [Thermoanaerobaculia bacterium]|nr:M56 family metallopeptidase [Thermoanaerobaculia bacterium]
MTAVIVKSTLAMLMALLVVASARRSRASLRHLVLAALFLFLLLLPVVQRFAPALDIPVQKAALADVVATPQPEQPAGVVTLAPLVREQSNVPRRFDYVSVIVPVYLTVAALLLAWLAVGILRLRRLADTGEVWLDGTARMNEIALEANIRRPALVVLSPDVAVPLTFGFRRSTIVLPEAARGWSAEELTRALRHELEHVRREDWFLQLAARAACALYWPHPFVWIAWRRFCLEAERACDDAVVGTSSAEAYAGQLVELARRVQRMNAVPALAMASRSKLALRVEAILDAKQQRGPHGRLATLGAFTVMLAFLVSIAPARIIEAAADHVESATRGDAIRDGVDGGTEGGVDDGVEGGVEGALSEALVKAAEAGDVEDVRRLLDAGVAINTVADGDGTALIGASRGGQMHMVQYLLERGADPNVVAPGDGSPLIAASRMGHGDIVKLLIRHRADVDQIVQGDENALMQAAWNGHAGIVELLIEEGADVNARAVEDGRVRTALSLARRGGHDDVVRMLLRAGAREGDWSSVSSRSSSGN